MRAACLEARACRLLQLVLGDGRQTRACVTNTSPVRSFAVSYRILSKPPHHFHLSTCFCKGTCKQSDTLSWIM